MGDLCVAFELVLLFGFGQQLAFQLPSVVIMRVRFEV